MNTSERVLAACAFQPTDRIPRVEFFWDYPVEWQARLGPIEAVNDVVILVPNEGPFPSSARLLRSEAEYLYEIDVWGRTIRRREDAYFVEALETAFAVPAFIESVVFESPTLESRYARVGVETIENHWMPEGTPDPQAVSAAIRTISGQACVFGKVGGPYLRSTYLRGETQYLIDIAQDPGLALAVAEKVAEHLIGVGIEEMRRWPELSGIWVFDDVAFNRGPLFSPLAFERIFLPCYRKMVNAFRRAGAHYVFFHSDGDIRRLLDGLVDAGFDGINPVEPRANMRVAELRKRYPRLILAGGMDNTGTLIHGSIDSIRNETLEILEVGRDGGVIIGSGYTGPDIPLDHFHAYHETCQIPYIPLPEVITP